MSTHDDHRPDDFPPDLKAFEAALAGLVPTGSRIDRDRLMYRAGAAATTSATKSPPNRFSRLPAMLWPTATAAMLLVTLGLGALIALRQPQERIVYVDRPAGSRVGGSPALATQWPDLLPSLASRENPATASYLALRQQVLRVGVESLDAPSHGGERTGQSDVRNRALLNHFLGS
jgi:hypothetical protein